MDEASGVYCDACMHARSLSRVWLYETPWTEACQAPLSMGFSREVYWSGLPCPPPGDLPDPGIEPIGRQILYQLKSSLYKWGEGDSWCFTEVGYTIRVFLSDRELVSGSVQSLSHVWLFATPWIAARQASLSITNSRSLHKLMSIESVMPSSHLILCHPLLLLPPIPPSIRVFSSESILCIRWPKY